jgi:dolichol-phosphate mannosyltransferase
MNPDKLLSLIVPVYFEQECIEQFIKETTEVLDNEKINYEIVFIDDGSQDNTVKIIKESAIKNNRLKLIEFSYNHGKQAALTAGIRYAKGDYLLMMDPDLQDPPIEIPQFIRKIEEGYDLVFGVRKEKKDKIINVIFSKLFWWVLEKFTGLNLPRGLAVMRIFNRKFANQFLKYEETSRFIEGLFIHISMKRTTLVIEQRPRFAGVSKFNFRRKMNLAFNAIYDFSEIPLKSAIKFGFFMMLFGLIAAVGIVIARVFFFKFQLGWPSLMITSMLGFGINLFFMGIIGIYIGKIYKESKKRPLFSIKEFTNLEELS